MQQQQQQQQSVAAANPLCMAPASTHLTPSAASDEHSHIYSANSIRILMYKNAFMHARAHNAGTALVLQVLRVCCSKLCLPALSVLLRMQQQSRACRLCFTTQRHALEKSFYVPGCPCGTCMRFGRVWRRLEREGALPEFAMP